MPRAQYYTKLLQAITVTASSAMSEQAQHVSCSVVSSQVEFGLYVYAVVLLDCLRTSVSAKSRTSFGGTTTVVCGRQMDLWTLCTTKVSAVRLS